MGLILVTDLEDTQNNLKTTFSAEKYCIPKQQTKNKVLSVGKRKDEEKNAAPINKYTLSTSVLWKHFTNFAKK